MATILYLSQAGALYKLDPALDARAQEDRLFYASRRLRDWLLNELHSRESTLGITFSPAQQFDAFIEQYASGEVLEYGRQFRLLKPVGDGVWELKTADLRVFGWFPHFDCFVGVVADFADRIKYGKLYSTYKQVVINFRNNLDLDEPKFIPGSEPHDVVSNYSFS